MQKSLIISVGTGIGSNEKAVESLAGAIAFSVKNHNPTKTFFVTSKESSHTLELISPKIGILEYEEIRITNPDNIRLIYEELKPKLSEIQQQFNPIIVDFTSGTKAMTSALAILSAIFEIDTLSYVSGKRKNGVVMSGTEEMQAVRPIFFICEKRISEARKFFNGCRYATALSIIDSIKKITADQSILKSTRTLQMASSAYSFWDKFEHGAAFKYLKPLKDAEFDQNKRFLGKLLHADEKEPYLIADLINNAKRRGDMEHKFDDAVARLYRTVELMAQYRLRKEYKIESANVDCGKLPESLLRKWDITETEDKIKIALERDYELLAATGDKMGEAFVTDKELGMLLSKRNNSILAHGMESVGKDVYQKLLGRTLCLAESILPNLKQDMEDSIFTTFST